MKLLIILALVIPQFSFAVSSTHCPHDCPSGVPSSNYTVSREPYILSNNGRTKFADWVAYRVSPTTIGGSRSRNWAADPTLWSSRTLEPEDYQGANAGLGTDRGHQAPLGSLSAYDDWRSLNYLSNITPQDSDLNQGPWRILEERVRALTHEVGELYVVTGPLYEYNFGSLPQANESHVIPSGYWKVVHTDNGRIQTAAFIMDQSTTRNADMCSYSVTIDEVERRSGLNVFPKLRNAWTVENNLGTLRRDLGC